MPIYLENRNVVTDLAHCRSVLIVPCPVCPAISLAVAHSEPYINFFRRFLTTAAYARAIDALQGSLDELTIPSTVCRIDIPIPLMCMWSAWQRHRLAKQARQHDAVVVLGCDAALHTVRQSVASTGCRIVNGMRVAGIVSVTPRFSWKGVIRLETHDRRCVAWPERSSSRIKVSS